MSMDEWLAHFNEAVEAYTIAICRGAIPSNREGVEAARIFRFWIDRFKQGSPDSTAILKAELNKEASERSLTAARLLIESGDRASLEELSQNVIAFRNRISRHDLKRLWLAVPPS